MAALQKIRSKSGLLIGVLGVALLAFILSGLFTSGPNLLNKFKDKAFTVDGQVVTTGEYMERVTEMEFFQRVMSNQTSLDEATLAQIKEMVYQQMVKEMMLDKETANLGLAVTPDELKDLAYGEHISPALYQIPLFVNQQGQFEKGKLIQFLQDINQDPSAFNDQQKEEYTSKKKIWAFIEKMLKYQRLEEKYTTLLSSSVLVSNTEVKSAEEDTKNVASFAYVVEKYNTIQDSTVQVSDKELKNLYDLRKNNFKLDTELRKVSYFVKDVAPSDEDYALVHAEIEKVLPKLQNTENPALVVNENSANPYIDAFMSLSTLPLEAKNFAQTAAIGQVYGPVRNDQAYIMYKLVDKTVASDSIRLQILPMPQGLTEKATALIADSLSKVVQGGKDFAVLVNEMYPSANGGDQGWVTEPMLTSVGIGKQCFAASKGELLTLAFGGQTQLVRISDKTNPVSKVKLAVVYMPVLVSDKTQQSIDNELNRFISENGNVENFNKEAQAKGYNLIADAIISPSDMRLGQIMTGSRQVINWAFNHEVGTVNKFDLADKRIIAIVKTNISDKYMPLNEVSEALKAELIKDKKAEKMIAAFTAKKLTSLEGYAQATGAKIDTAKFVTFQTNSISGLGYEPIFNVYSKIGQLNKLEAPLKGEAGIYAFSIIEKTENEKGQPEIIKQSLRQGLYSQLMSQTIIALKEKMDVKDNRVKFW